MADIFISYARSTAKQAQQIAEALRALGYGVWRDDELPAHRAYAEVIEERLKAAKAVVVIWSAEGVKSQWVRAEADVAREAGTLVQLSIDGVVPPMPFNQIQCAEMSGWTGDLAASGWRKVVASIADLVGGAPPAHAANIQTERQGISICVLPFANMSNDAEQEYFSDGISEDIITDLSKVSALAVISRNSAFAFKGKHVDLPAVARTLNVSHVLEGSVRKSGNRVRITAQLIDGATNGHVWAERYDRDLSDIFTLQDEISEAIVTALKLKLFPEEKKAIEDRGTTNVEAYDLYLRANTQLRQLTAQSAQRAVALYQEALELDPRFGDAWLGLSHAYRLAVAYQPQSAETWRRLQAEAAERGIALITDPRRIELVQGVQFLFGSRDWIRAGDAFERSVGLDPSCLRGAQFDDLLPLVGIFLACTGRVTEAIEWFRTIVKTDPLRVLLIYQPILDCAGRHEEAEAEYRRVVALPGDPAFAEYFALRRAMAREGRQSVKVRFRRYLALGDGHMSIHADVLAKWDDRAAVLALVRGAFEDPFYQDASRMTGLASLAALFGDDELALACLKKCFGERYQYQIADLWHPQFAPARKLAGFRDLVRDLGIADYWRKSGKWGDFARPVGADDFEIVK